MGVDAQFVCGGGWKGTRKVQIKAKAWGLLFAAVIFGEVTLAASALVWVIVAGAVAGLSLLTSVLLFWRETPRVFECPSGRTGGDPWNLYGSLGREHLETGTLASSHPPLEEGRPGFAPDHRDQY